MGNYYHAYIHPVTTVTFFNSTSSTTQISRHSEDRQLHLLLSKIKIPTELWEALATRGSISATNLTALQFRCFNTFSHASTPFCLAQFEPTSHLSAQSVIIYCPDNPLAIASTIVKAIELFLRHKYPKLETDVIRWRENSLSKFQAKQPKLPLAPLRGDRTLYALSTVAATNPWLTPKKITLQVQPNDSIEDTICRLFVKCLRKLTVNLFKATPPFWKKTDSNWTHTIDSKLINWYINTYAAIVGEQLQYYMKNPRSFLLLFEDHCNNDIGTLLKGAKPSFPQNDLNLSFLNNAYVCAHVERISDFFGLKKIYVCFSLDSSQIFSIRGNENACIVVPKWGNTNQIDVVRFLWLLSDPNKQELTFECWQPCNDDCYLINRILGSTDPNIIPFQEQINATDHAGLRKILGLEPLPAQSH